VTNLFQVIEDVVFARLDIRMAQRLIELAGRDSHITSTQQQLASELGTAREVASRLLNEFQRRGWLTLMRGGITIDDRDALASLAAQG
jgi:CRP/FNR family transcriptional regulator, anaerobic regulatory protein